MLYCNLKGGLGNMLFQIAAVSSMAKDIGTEASFPNLFRHLSYLNREGVCNPNLKHSMDYLSFLSPLRTQMPTTTLPTIGFPLHFEYKDVPLNCWVDGFFQSEKYFAHNRVDILDLFLETDQMIGARKEYFSKDSKITISVHVRRGDYLKSPNHHPVANELYYVEAISKLEPFDVALVFSDDVAWCKDTFTDPRFVFPEEKDYIEIYLMSKCDKHIVANSSFSWWGAWLSSRTQVIAPKRHFGEALNNTKDSDIYPESWNRI